MLGVGAGVSSENWEPGSRSVIKIDCVKLAALDLAMLLWSRDHKMAAFTLTSSLYIVACELYPLDPSIHLLYYLPAS